MSITFDQVADDLAHTYTSIEQVLLDARATLDRTRSDVEYVCNMDPGLRSSLEDDLGAAAQTLDRLSGGASSAGSALRNYAEAIRAQSGRGMV